MKNLNWLIAGFGIIILFALGAVMVMEQADKDVEVAPIKVADELLYKKYSPKLGNPDAKVKLVEFFDPACGTCAAFYPFVKDLMTKYPDQIELQLRYAPFHENSDFVVAVLEASRLQNGFWTTLELLYNNQALWIDQHVVNPQKVVALLQHSDLDLERLEKDFQSPSIINRIEEDMANATAIPVEKTPDFFVNGRPLAQFGYQQLADLVAEEINKVY